MSKNPDQNKFNWNKLKVPALALTLALGTTACGDKVAGAEHNTDTPAATATATPGETESSTSTPVETPAPSETSTPSTSETEPSDAISEQLMSNDIDATRFATYPLQARIDAGLYVVKGMMDTLDNVELFAGDLPDGTNLWDNNPFDKPLHADSSYENISNQSSFFQELILCQRASLDSPKIDQDKAMKIAYSFTIDPNGEIATDWEETIPNTPNGNVLKSSTEKLYYTIPKNQDLTKVNTTLPDGTETVEVTGTEVYEGNTYSDTFVFVPVPQLGEGNGVWLKTSSQLVK